MEDDFTVDQREKMEAEAKQLADQRATESATESARQLAIEEARRWAREEKRRAHSGPRTQSGSKNSSVLNTRGSISWSSPRHSANSLLEGGKDESRPIDPA